VTGTVPAAVAIALLASAILVPFVSRLAHRLGAVATPRSDRWNRRAVPILGGLAITAGVVSGSLLIDMRPIDRIALLAGIAIIAGLGLADDLGSVSAPTRLSVEALVAVGFAIAVSGELDLPIRLAAVAVAAACVPVAINATNLVDNADGLASLLTTITGAALAGMVALGRIDTPGGPMSLVVAAACIGFLFHNRPPARVFMGDSGSLMLGFTLAACSILIVRDAVLVTGQAHVAAAIAIPLVWSLQLGDLAMVFITRLRRRSSPFAGGVDHTSHRLLDAGIGPTAMLFALSLASAIVGAIAVALVVWAGDFRLVAVLAVVAAVAVGGFEAVVAWRLPFRGVPESGVAASIEGSASPAAAGVGGVAAGLPLELRNDLDGRAIEIDARPAVSASSGPSR
jgi:UDP-GlcNAc:undecaprenyl-phosphate GlcNAc-1-phosphate transferase